MQMRQVLWMRDMGDSLTEEAISIGVAPLVAVEYAFPVILETLLESDDQMRQALWMRDMGDKLLMLMLTEDIFAIIVTTRECLEVFLIQIIF